MHMQVVSLLLVLGGLKSLSFMINIVGDGLHVYVLRLQHVEQEHVMARCTLVLRSRSGSDF